MSLNNLLNSYNRDSTELESIVHDLLVNNDVPFDNEEVDVVQNTIVKIINSRINQASARYSGLVMLDKILFGCSKNIVSKYALLWITRSIELLENMLATTQEITLTCKILGFLLIYCKEVPELHKQISMQTIKQLISVLNNLLKREKYGAIYYLIAVMLYHYPEICERSQDSIKKIILLHIDSVHENLVNASAKCYVLLSKATERSFKPPATKSMYTRWTYNQALLCNSLHTIMDELFSELIELKTVDIWDKLDLSPIPEENAIQYYNKQKQRFFNLCIYLSSLLQGYDAKNSVVPHDILEVLCRGLAITPLNLKDRTSFKEQMLYIILPKLHIGLLTVLNAFINGFAQELIPFGKTILNLLQQMLQWTSTILENHLTFSSNKSFKNVRISIYKCFCSWLMNTNSLSGIETIANDCITFIMKDIMPEKDRILLTVQKPQHWSKRVTKRFKNSQYVNSLILKGKTNVESGSLDADLCKEALITLQNILHSGGILLKQVFYKNIQDIVISLLYNFYLNNSAPSFYKDHNKCRLELFKVLKALQMNPHTTLVSPIQYYLEISHRASYDVDLSIAQEAKLAITELEKIIHPAAPTLQLPLQDEPDTEFLPENLAEETTDTATVIVATNSNKKSMIDHVSEYVLSECPISPSYEWPKMPRYTKTIQDTNNTKSIEIDDNEANVNKFQADENPHENIRNLLQERNKGHYDIGQGPSNNNLFANVNTETRIECESVARVTTKDRGQYEKSENPPFEDGTDEMLGSSSSLTTKVVQKNTTQKEVRQKEKESDDDSETLNMFSDIP